MVSIGIDTAILAAVVQARTPLLTELFIPVTALGSAVFTLVLIATLYLFRERKTAVTTFLGVAVAGGLGELINIIVKRPRPELTLQILPETAGGYAFPSGHTTVAFVLATVLAHRYGRPAYFYALAILVGMSRVYLGVHYPTDVIGGAVLGWVTATLLVRSDDRIMAAVPDVLRNNT